MASLFDTPEEVMQQRALQGREQAMMNNPRMQNAGAVNDLRSQVRQNRSADMRSGAVGNMAQTLMPNANIVPELKKAYDIKNIREKVNQKFKFGTPEYFEAVSTELAQNGYQNEALKAKEVGMNFMSKGADTQLKQKKLARYDEIIDSEIDSKKTTGSKGFAAKFETFQYTDDTGKPQRVTLDVGDQGQRSIAQKLVTEYGANKLESPTTSVEVINKATEKFGEKFEEAQVERMEAVMERGDEAVSKTIVARQMQDLWQSGLQTGAVQEFLTPIQNLADSVGFNLQEFVDDSGIDIGDLTQKKYFDKLANNMIVRGMADFKSNLNQKEVELAIEGQAGLGDNEETNLMTIASYLTAGEFATKTADDAREASGLIASANNTEEYRKAKRNLQKIINRPRNGSGDDFLKRRNEIMDEMRGKRDINAQSKLSKKAEAEGFTTVGLTDGSQINKATGKPYPAGVLLVEDKDGNKGVYE